MVLSEKPFGGRKQKRKAKQKSSGAGESNLGPLSDNPNCLLTELLFGDERRDQKSKRQTVSWKTTKPKRKWQTGKKPKNQKAIRFFDSALSKTPV